MVLLTCSAKLVVTEVHHGVTIFAVAITYLKSVAVSLYSIKVARCSESNLKLVEKP